MISYHLNSFREAIQFSRVHRGAFELSAAAAARPPGLHACSPRSRCLPPTLSLSVLWTFVMELPMVSHDRLAVSHLERAFSCGVSHRKWPFGGEAVKAAYRTGVLDVQFLSVHLNVRERACGASVDAHYIVAPCFAVSRPRGQCSSEYCIYNSSHTTI